MAAGQAPARSPPHAGERAGGEVSHRPRIRRPAGMQKAAKHPDPRGGAWGAVEEASGRRAAPDAGGSETRPYPYN